MLRLPLAVSPLRITCTHCLMNSGLAAMLVREGTPDVISLPSFVLPLPASCRQLSVRSCGPTAETGKPTDVVSFATHPSMGTVSALITPCDALSARNCVYGGTLTFSKNQSLSRFHAWSCQ